MAFARSVKKLENDHFWFLTKDEVIVTHEPKTWTYIVSLAREKPYCLCRKHTIEICMVDIESESEGTNNGHRVSVIVFRLCSNHYSNSRIEWSGAEEDQIVKIRMTTTDKIIIRRPNKREKIT